MPNNCPNTFQTAHHKLIRSQREEIANLKSSLLVKVAQIAQLEDEKQLLQSRLEKLSLQLQLQRMDEDSGMGDGGLYVDEQEHNVRNV